MKIIRYKFLSCKINHGTEEAPDFEDVVLGKEIRCENADFETNYAIAQAEAYNGEVTVEEVEEAETSKTIEQRVETLETSNAEMTEALDLLLSGVTE